MYRILLVEDNEDFREIMTFILEKSGFSVKNAANGKEGFELFNHWQFDLIITDIFMPVMDGNEFISKLSEFSDLPKIIACSYNLFDIAPNPVITKIFSKPLTTQQLLLTVNQTLDFTG